MIKPTIKATYKNKYAVIHVIDNIAIGGSKYMWLFIATLDGIIYDTIICPYGKYKQDKQMFVIYHTDDSPEVFYRVDTCTL